MCRKKEFTKEDWRKEMLEDHLDIDTSLKKVYNPITKDILNELDNTTNIRAVLNHLDVYCITYKLNFKEIVSTFIEELYEKT